MKCELFSSMGKAVLPVPQPISNTNFRGLERYGDGTSKLLNSFLSNYSLYTLN